MWLTLSELERITYMTAGREAADVVAALQVPKLAERPAVWITGGPFAQQQPAKQGDGPQS
jgi:hypothetical protein